MIVLHEQFTTSRPAREVFAYACEFAHCEQWDATAVSSRRIDAGPTRVGSRYRVVCRLPVGRLALHYRVLKWQPDEQVVLEGSCAAFKVTDTITVRPDGAGTRLDYRAEFRFGAALRPLEPAMEAGLRRMGKASIAGLQEALEDRLAPPRPSAATRWADRCILPGVARFSKLGISRSRRHWRPVSSYLGGRHIVLTGASSGIGLAAARQLAAMGASLTLVVRDEARGRALVEQLRKDTGNEQVAIELADLSLMADVQRLVQRLLAQGRPIDVLINNAGALFNPRQVTAEGLEQSFALLLLAPYLLTEGLLPLLRRGTAPRVVNVVSGGMYTQQLVVRDLQSDRGRYSGSVAYARAKRALMVQSEEWAQAWQADGIVCNAMHPGWADTPGVAQALPAFRRIMRGVLRTPEEGADTVVWLAAAREAGKVSGLLFLDREPHPTHLLARTRESAGERVKLLEMLRSYAARFRAGQDAGA